MKGLLKFFLLLIAGFLMALAHPFQFEDFVFYWPRLGWLLATGGICLFLKFATESRTPFIRFLQGLFAGFVFFFVTLFWVSLALHEHGDIEWSISILAAALLAFYCSLYMGLFALIGGSIFVEDRPPLIKIICWAALWASVEALRESFLSGFPWGELGYAFADSPLLAKTAGLWGVHGFTFLWVLLAGLLLQSESIVRDWISLRKIALFILLLITLFFWNERSLQRRYENSETARISIVQPDIAQDVKWNPGSANAHLQKLVRMTEEAGAAKPQLIAWPETAFPFLLGGEQKQIPVHSEIPLLIGAVVRDGEFNRNSALLVEGEQATARFDKIHLVPFGEYVPLQKYLPFGKLVANAGDFVPGSFHQGLLQPLHTSLKIGPLICYEDVFANLSVNHARLGANLLLNMTNDAWYGKSSALAQHALMSSMQVYSTGIPMVRATNNGESSFITPFEAKKFPLFESLTATEDIKIPKQKGKSFFVATFPLMQWIWIAILIAGIFWKEESSDRYQRRRIFFKS